MRTHAISLGQMWMKVVIELLLFFPLVWMLFLIFISMPFMEWLALLAGFYSLGYMASAWFRLNAWYSLVLSALGCSLVIVFGGLGLNYNGVVSGLVGIYLFFRGTFIAKRSWSIVFPIPYYWIGLFLYFVESVVLRFNSGTQQYVPLLFWLGLISVAITLLMTSQERIIQESLPEKNGRHLVTPAQLWQARVLSLGVLLLIGFFATIQQLGEGLQWLNYWFWNSASAILHWLNKLMTTTNTEAPIQPAEQPPMMLPEANNPSLFMIWLEKILYVLLVVFLFALLLLLTYVLYKKVFRYIVILFRWFAGRLSVNRTEKSSGYEDESIRLVTLRELIGSYGIKVSHWLDQLRMREVKWGDLTSNAERIRYLYRLFVMKSLTHSLKVDTHLTAQEIILSIRQGKPELSHTSEKLSQLYNQARYSEHPIEDEDVKALSKALKND